MKPLKIILPIALSLLLVSCGDDVASSSSSDGSLSSSEESSSLSSSSSEGPSSSSSQSFPSSSSTTIPGEGIPSAMEGTWVGASETRRFELTASPGSLLLNGKEGEIVSPFKAISGGYRGTVDFGEGAFIVDYYSSPITGDVYVDLSDSKASVRLYKDGNAMPPVPSRMEGTWEGVDLFNLEDTSMHTLVLGGGAPRLDGKEGILWEIDPASYEGLLTFGDLAYGISYVESGTEPLLDVYCEETGFQSLMEKVSEGGEEEGDLLTAPEEMWGTWEGDGHVAIIGEKGLWALDGETPKEVTLKDGYYYLLLNRASCYLKLLEDEEGPYLELTSLQESLEGKLRKR